MCHSARSYICVSREHVYLVRIWPAIEDICMYQKRVSRAGTSNYIQQMLLDVITCPCLETCLWHTRAQFEVKISFDPNKKIWTIEKILVKDQNDPLVYNRNIKWNPNHYNDVIMSEMASQITSITIFFSTVHSRLNQRKIKASCRWSLCREFTGHRWIPRTNRQ